MNTIPKRTALYVAVTSLAVLLLLPSRLTAQAASGPEVWAANCGSCHRLRSLETYTASQWNTVATHMGLVARLTGDETRAVREFLVGSARARETAETVRRLTPDLAGVPAVGTSGGAHGAALRTAQGRNDGRVLGRDIYRVNCVACHGPEGRGNGPVAAALTPRPTDFTNAAQRLATTDGAVAGVIERGRGSMPAFGRILTHEQIDSVVAHLRTFRR